MLDAFTATLPSRRLGRPEEGAAVIALLLFEDASHILGVVLPVERSLPQRWLASEILRLSIQHDA